MKKNNNLIRKKEEFKNRFFNIQPKNLIPFFLILFLVFGNIMSYGQKRIISGSIKDANTGEGLPGVNIVVVGTTTGSVSDVDGNYSIEASPGQSLEFSFIGYKNQIIDVADQTVIDVKLEEDVEKLDEVVVVGYGVMKRSDVTGSVVSVRDEDLTAIPTTNALEALQGKVAGLDLTVESGQTGAGLNFNIRGKRSAVASNDPLILVDGIDYGTSVDINPNDIQSIEILKDASSTAIYGSRGANGVIIITTKRGQKQSNVSFNAYYGKIKITDYPEFFLGNDYIEFAREAARTAKQWKSEEDDEKILFPYGLFNDSYNVNWRDLLIHDGFSQSYQLSITGGNEKTTYLFSNSFTNEHGIFKMDEFRRYNGRLNIDHEVYEWLNFGANISYIYTDRDIRKNPLNMANKMIPVAEVYDSTGKINPFPLNDGNIISPMADEQPGAWKNDTITKRFFYTSYFDVKLHKNLKLKTTLGIDITDGYEGKWADHLSIERGTGTNYASIETSNNTNLLLDNILTFSKDFNIHNLQILAGNSLIKNTKTDAFSQGAAFPINTFLYYNLEAATNEILNKSSFRKNQLVSFFGRVHYKLLNKYIFQVTLRADGASVLASGHKWAYFPSGSFAWRLKEEGFMQTVNFISDIKLKASYGVSGNSSVNPYQTQSLYGRTIYTWDDNIAAGYYPKLISNSELGWETTATTNLGFDLSMFSNKINIYFDVYRQHTYNLILDSKLPTTSGFVYITENIGDTENKGIEVAIGSVNINSKSGFRWTSDLTFFANKEQFLKLTQAADRDLSNKWFVGYPIDVFYSYKKTGIWQTKDSLMADFYGFRPGDIKLEDYNKDGKINNKDRVVLGQERPKWSGSIKNSFYFKGFELSCLIYARMGQTIEFEGYDWGSYWYAATASGVKVDYWTPENATDNFPRPDRLSSRRTDNEALKFVDGSYIKVRDLTFGYSIPNNIIDKLRVSKVRIYTTLKNYFILYNTIDGYDSERGGDLGYPMTKQWLLGINTEF